MSNSYQLTIPIKFSYKIWLNAQKTTPSKELVPQN